MASPRTTQMGELRVTVDDPGAWVVSDRWDLRYVHLDYLVQRGPEDSALRVVVVEYVPGAEVLPHSHPVDYVSIVVKGSMRITRRQHEVGSIRLVKAGTTYGPLEAGPEGCTVIDVFGPGDAAMTLAGKAAPVE